MEPKKGGSKNKILKTQVMNKTWRMQRKEYNKHGNGNNEEASNPNIKKGRRQKKKK